MNSLQEPLPRASRRLWPVLSRQIKRTPPPDGFDVVGSWAHSRYAQRAIQADRTGRAELIVQESDTFKNYSDAVLRERIEDTRTKVLLGKNRAEAVNSAFAISREVVRRELGLSLYLEQIIGGLIMAEGACAEMATGEGKTVTAILPAVVHGWSGRGVHVLTVNDYLAARDAEITAPVYKRLGLSIGVVIDETPRGKRKAAYDSDITYAADKQIVFDFLRDQLDTPPAASLAGSLLHDISGDGEPEWHSKVVHRGFNAVIIDEVDSILIDEAATPAIIAAEELGEGSGEDPTGAHHIMAASIARQLILDEDYKVDRKLRHVEISQQGRDRLKDLTQSLPAFWTGPRRSEEIVRTALVAKEIQVLGDDYIKRDDKIEIVDRSTGRVLEGRQWQMGLHQAVEAKEGLDPTKARRTSTRISYARFFQQYRHLAGMSGTLKEVSDELWRTYNVAVVRVPTHKPIVRDERSDIVFSTEQEKLDSVVERVVDLNSTGQPVLVGTRSVLTSESIGCMLQERGVACQILNAEREEEEASIVQVAGKVGAVTVATNMAGRGTDIKLDTEAVELGGLFVIGTERNSERRVDRQLFGRSGRQGDPGIAQMYVSLEDQLIHASGLPPLIWLTRRTMFRLFHKLLWRQSQLLASRRAISHRMTTAKSDSWQEMAMHTSKR
jgi:preprotein translocase subunit SecA